MGGHFYPTNRVSIFVGALGSGKTELAINTALMLAQEVPVALVDLDVINPYYRVRKVKTELARLGVDVVCPPDALMQADVPALTPAIWGVLSRDDQRGVFDVGGDDIGAIVLGSLRPSLPTGHYAVYFVVNTCRAHSATRADIHLMIDRIERTARVGIDYLINNTNLGPETDAATVVEGRRILGVVAGERGVSVACTGVRPGIAAAVRALDAVTPVFRLRFFMRPPWETEV
ncbi:MAG: hypothetical protein IBX71_11525 [Candidatus Desulforudis sp.]|nr:hypothetical protein [Desulforudis sp.]